jgi:hypothetical protein
MGCARVASVLTAAMSATAGLAFVGTTPAHADSKVYEDVRYQSSNSKILNWATYDSNGNPATRDAACPTFPGVRKWSKVYADVYLNTSAQLHAAFRMQFHTTYYTSVAVAKRAIEQVQGRAASCSEIDGFAGNGNVKTLKATACDAAPAQTSVNRPSRWCTLAAMNTLPPSVDLTMNATCRTPMYGGMWGLGSYHSWHDIHSLFYTVKLIGIYNVPVYVDDVDFVGGVDNWNTATDQPAWGNQWVGYGRTQSAYWSEQNVLWYDNVARHLGYSPIANPLTAHRAVQSAIDHNTFVSGVGYAGKVYYWFKLGACADNVNSPKIKDVLDPAMNVSRAGMDQDISAWVTSETGLTLCQNLKQNLGLTGDSLTIACQFGTMQVFVALIDNNTGMNQQAVTCPNGVTYPQNLIAQFFGIDLGCGRVNHIVGFFKKLKQALGA